MFVHRISSIFNAYIYAYDDLNWLRLIHHCMCFIMFDLLEIKYQENIPVSYLFINENLDS